MNIVVLDLILAQISLIGFIIILAKTRKQRGRNAIVIRAIWFVPYIIAMASVAITYFERR